MSQESLAPAWLARTTLSPPVRQGDLIPRPALLAALADANAVHSLTLVSALAGYGKTTLLAQYMAACASESAAGRFSILPTGSQAAIAKRVAWLSLDEEDNDLTRFLAALVICCRRLVPDCDDLAWPAQIGDRSGVMEAMRPAMAVLINAIAATSCPLTLILDDLHLIVEPAIYVTMDYLLARAPPHLHLIIGTRRDPPLALARLRARGQLAELRTAEPRFTADEAWQFLNDRLGLGLSADDLATLYARTEGWPAGLRLLAGSLDPLHEPVHGAAWRD